MELRDVAGHLGNADHVTFIIGAGASVSAGIPLAGELVRRINDGYSHCLGRLTDDDRKKYGRVMAALTPGERKAFLTPILNNATLNWGHIALVEIMNRVKVGRVLTFNFDLLLEQAASLAGCDFPVYDFAVAPTADLVSLAAPAIFHLHGQSYGLKLMNSDDETEAHRDNLRPIIADSLRRGLVIVAGYSGEADAVLPVIEAAYGGEYRLLWLGFEAEPKPHLRTLFGHTYAHYIGGCDFDRTMIAIARDLGCWPPPLFVNPPRHAFERLKIVADFPVADDGAFDILSSTRHRLMTGAGDWDRDTEADSTAKVLSASLSGADLGQPSDTMSEEEREARAWRLVGDGDALSDMARKASSGDRAQRYLDAGRAYKAALAVDPNFVPALANWGNALAEEAHPLFGDDRVRLLHEAGKKYAEALRLRPDDADVLSNWGNALSEEARYLSGEERLRLLRDAEEKNDQALRFSADSAHIMSNLGLISLLEATGSSTQIRQPILERAAERFTKAVELGSTPQYNHVCVLALLDRRPEALDLLDACEAVGTLPPLDHIKSDTDLDSLRGEPRFKALIERLEAKG